MSRVVAPMAALFALAAAVAVADDLPKDPEAKLLGKWKLTKSSKGDLPPGLEASITFEKGMKFKMRVEFMGKGEDGAGTWKLDGKKMTVEYTEGREKGKTETMEVKKLSDEEFVTVDDKGVTEEFKKVKDKDK
jgi:uncharacterized protein (TIGR03066 family)